MLMKNFPNAYQAIMLLEVSRHYKSKRIVYCSSMARYGNASSYKENDIPLNFVENYFRKYILCDTHDVVIVLISKQKFDDFSMVSIMVLPTNRQPIIYGDGEQQMLFY